MMYRLRQIFHEATGDVAVTLTERLRIGPFHGKQTWEEERVLKEDMFVNPHLTARQRKIRAYLLQTFEEQWQDEVIHEQLPAAISPAERAIRSF